MSTIVTRKVVDLSEPSRQTLEELLGRGLAADERVSVLVDAFYPVATRRAIPAKPFAHSNYRQA